MTDELRTEVEQVIEREDVKQIKKLLLELNAALDRVLFPKEQREIRVRTLPAC